MLIGTRYSGGVILMWRKKIFTYEKNIVMDNLVSADLRISMDNID
jgi:hypothetical protein